MSSSRNRNSVPDNESWDWLIGEITAPHGLRGEVRVYPHTDFPERFRGLERVAVRHDGQPPRVMEIEAARVQDKRIVVKFAGVDTVEQAEGLRGARLYIPEAWAVPLDEGEYYHHQLLGLMVETTTGESLGPITQIWPTGANDVYETPLALIPATWDIIRSIDVQQGKMVVDARPGLKKSDSGD